MENVLEVYKRPHRENYPLVCLDEANKQLVKETRLPLPPKSGEVERYDYEYERRRALSRAYHAVINVLGTD